MQTICDANKRLWNVYACQLGGVHDSGQLKMSSVYKQLKNREILQELVVVVRRVRCTPYIIGDAIYPILAYLQKSWNTHNVIDVGKHIYDSSMNLGRVVIENAFGSLKNKWCILRHLNFRVDKVSRVDIACCVLHNYCLKWGTPKLGPPNVAAPQNNFQGFGDRLRTTKEGKIAKVEREKIRTTLFEQWLINNPIEE